VHARVIDKTRRGGLLLVLTLTGFLLLSGVHIQRTKDCLNLSVNPGFSVRQALAFEQSSAGGSALFASEESGAATTAEESESKAAEEGAEEEESPVKYSIWQDFCALLLAAIIIAAAYSFIKRKAAQPSKDDLEQGGVDQRGH